MRDFNWKFSLKTYPRGSHVRWGKSSSIIGASYCGGSNVRGVRAGNSWSSDVRGVGAGYSRCSNVRGVRAGYCWGSNVCAGIRVESNSSNSGCSNKWGGYSVVCSVGGEWRSVGSYGQGNSSGDYSCVDCCKAGEEDLKRKVSWNVFSMEKFTYQKLGGHCLVGWFWLLRQLKADWWKFGRCDFYMVHPLGWCNCLVFEWFLVAFCPSKLCQLFGKVFGLWWMSCILSLEIHIGKENQNSLKSICNTSLKKFLRIHK